MKQPKWQRARILRSAYPDLIGRLLWVRMEPPHMSRPIHRDTKVRAKRAHAYVPTNIAPVVAMRHVYAIDRLELLARGPEDFADDVELITWEQWLKESAPEKPA